jgi:hypothetical protein
MASRFGLPTARCYVGTVSYGYDEECDHGSDVAPPPVRPYSGMPNQYEYDEPDNDDYKVFPPPGPDTVIESTGHGYTIVPMTVTTCDKGDGDAPPPACDDMFAMAANEQPKTPVAAVNDGCVVAAARGGSGAGVEVDEEELEGKFYYEYEFYDANDNLARRGGDNHGEEHQ